MEMRAEAAVISMNENENKIVKEFLQQEYDLLAENMLSFVGKSRKQPSKIKWMEENFGGDKISIIIDEELLQYLWRFHSRTHPYPPIFDEATIKKWEIVTVLACGNYMSVIHEGGKVSEIFSDGIIEKVDYSQLAALAGFPLLESLSGKISKKWDVKGYPTENLAKDQYNISKSYSFKEEKHRNKSNRISSFKDKMKIMMAVLPEETQKSWANFERHTLHSSFDSSLKIDSLLERLNERRNSWAHGQEFEGHEGVLISLIIRFLYLNCVMFEIR